MEDSEDLTCISAGNFTETIPCSNPNVENHSSQFYQWYYQRYIFYLNEVIQILPYQFIAQRIRIAPILYLKEAPGTTASAFSWWMTAEDPLCGTSPPSWMPGAVWWHVKVFFRCDCMCWTKNLNRLNHRWSRIRIGMFSTKKCLAFQGAGVFEALLGVIASMYFIRCKSNPCNDSHTQDNPRCIIIVVGCQTIDVHPILRLYQSLNRLIFVCWGQLLRQM